MKAIQSKGSTFFLLERDYFQNRWRNLQNEPDVSSLLVPAWTWQIEELAKGPRCRNFQNCLFLLETGAESPLAARAWPPPHRRTSPPCPRRSPPPPRPRRCRRAASLKETAVTLRRRTPLPHPRRCLSCRTAGRHRRAALEAAAPSLPWPAAASAARRDVVYEENGNDYVQGEEENRGGPQCFFLIFY
jgi:hypothetical protein